MNLREKDILTIIKYHGPMTSAGLQEHLSAPTLGYNLEVKQISKIASKMKSNGLLTSEERPNPGTKPLTYWMLPEAEEMASDVVEVETPAIETPETYRDTWTTPPAVGVEFKAAPNYDPRTVAFPKRPMSAFDAIMAFKNEPFSRDDMAAFMAGIVHAERHHGITE